MSTIAPPISLSDYLVVVAGERFDAYDFAPFVVEDCDAWESDPSLDEGARYACRVYLQTIPPEPQAVCGTFVVEFDKAGNLTRCMLEGISGFASKSDVLP